MWRALLVLAAMCLMLAPVAGGEVPTNGNFARADARGFPEAWQLAVFHQSPRPDVAVADVEGRRACQITFPQTHQVYCVSLYQAAPPLDTDGEYVVRLSYQATVAGTGDMSVALSGGPGCSLPCARAWLALVRDGAWHEATIRLPARCLKRDGSVLELCFNNAYQAGDRIRIAGLKMAFEPDPPVALSFTNPPSGVVFTDSRSQALEGIVRVTRAAAGRRARVALQDARAPGRDLDVRDLATTYPRTRWRFDLRSRPIGKLAVVARLLNADGVVAAAQDRLTAWRLRPSPTTTRVVDGRPYRGDRPILLLGTYHVADWAVDVVNTENRRIGVPPLTRAAMLDGVARQGFGTFLYTSGIPPEGFLADCRRRGLMPIPQMAGVGRDWGGAPIVEQVPRVADDPRILGWGGYDEPGLQSMPLAVRVYRELKSVSPRKLVVSSFNDPHSLLALEGDATPADLILMDTYTISAADADLSRVGQAVAQAAAYARAHPGLAVGVTPQAFIYLGGPEPTPAQLRAQVYLGLVNGARAFFPYSYIEDYGAQPFSAVPGQPSAMSLNPRRNRWFLPDSRMWQEWGRIARELRHLEPVILGDGRPLSVAAEAGPVQWLARRTRSGGTLIAVNPRATEQRATFRFRHPPRRLAPLFGTPPVTLDGSTLALDFASYEVKAFRLSGHVSGSGAEQSPPGRAKSAWGGCAPQARAYDCLNRGSGLCELEMDPISPQAQIRDRFHRQLQSLAEVMGDDDTPHSS